MSGTARDLNLSEQTQAAKARYPPAHRASAAAILFFSLAYFTQTLLRAWQKRFWFDELCSYYVSRQPTFHDSWTAVLHGADFSPPLFYLIQRADAAVFGYGAIAFRLPQIFSFWVLCLCLFWVVRRSAGVLAGFVAMSLPFVSGAYYYAYEARPHAIVLGLAAVALLCWLHLLERPRSALWLTGFALSLEAAFFVHCYALALVVPFGLVELVRNARAGKINWRFWLALALPACLAVITFVPLLHAYHRNMQGTDFINFFAPGINQFGQFYKFLLEPCLLVLLFTALALAFSPGRQLEPGSKSDQFPHREWLSGLAAAFLGLPLYGILLGKIVHGPFFARYFLSAVIGAGIVIGFAADSRRKNPGSRVLAAFLACLMIWNTAAYLRHLQQHSYEPLVEPSSGYLVDTDRQNNLATYPLLTSADPNLPVAIPGNLDFIYLAHYWPAGRSRMYPVFFSKDTTEYRTTIGLVQYCHIAVSPPLIWKEFLSKRRDFLVYSSQSGNYQVLTQLIRQGAILRDLQFAPDGSFLANIHMSELPDSVATR